MQISSGKQLYLGSPEMIQRSTEEKQNRGLVSNSQTITLNPLNQNNIMMTGESVKQTPKSRSRAIYTPQTNQQINNVLNQSQQSPCQSMIMEQSMINEEDLLIRVEQVQETIRTEQHKASEEFKSQLQFISSDIGYIAQQTISLDEVVRIQKDKIIQQQE